MMDEKKEVNSADQPQGDAPPSNKPDQPATEMDVELVAHDAAMNDIVDEMGPGIEIAPRSTAAEPEQAAAAPSSGAAPAAEQSAPPETSAPEANPPATSAMQAAPAQEAQPETAEPEQAPSAETQTEADPAPAATPDDTPASDSTGAVAPVSEADGEQPEASEPAAVTVSEEQLAQARGELLTMLLGERRLSTAKLAELSAAHAERVSAAGSDLATEIATLAEAIKSKDTESRQTESAQMAETSGTLSEFNDAIEQLYQELPKTAAVVGEGIEARGDELLESLDEALRESLSTYRQGLEIIHRMFSRSIDRKPNLVPMEVNFGEVESKVEGVTDAAQFSETLEKVSKDYHDMRDKNYHLIHDAKNDCEKQISKVKISLKQVLSAMDGIDSGLQNEQETRAAAGDTSELDEKASEVVSAWYGAYDRLSEALDTLVANTALTPVATEPGTPFDPETMEPQGVVENPDYKDDDVAFVLRRGFLFCGHLIRPALVEVVKNS